MYEHLCIYVCVYSVHLTKRLKILAAYYLFSPYDPKHHRKLLQFPSYSPQLIIQLLQYYDRKRQLCLDAVSILFSIGPRAEVLI